MTESKQHNVPNVYGAANTTNEEPRSTAHLFQRLRDAGYSCPLTLDEIDSLEDQLETLVNVLKDIREFDPANTYVNALADTALAQFGTDSPSSKRPQ